MQNKLKYPVAIWEERESGFIHAFPLLGGAHEQWGGAYPTLKNAAWYFTGTLPVGMPVTIVKEDKTRASGLVCMLGGAVVHTVSWAIE